MKQYARLLFILAVIPAILRAEPTKVFARGDLAKIAALFRDKGPFVFELAPSGRFTSPAVLEYVNLKIPASIKMERKEHNVDVGVILSAKGEVAATCIVSSDCKALEGAAVELVQALKFRPVSVDGTPVYFYFVFPVSYRYRKLTEPL
jgi:hypothetical protein